MATKIVLLLGVLAFGALLFFHSPVFDVLYIWPGAPPKSGLFEGLGPVAWFWIALLAVAALRDFLVSRRDRNAVKPFAAVLNADPVNDSVDQVSDLSVMSTSTSGSVGNRLASVTLRDSTGRTTRHVLRVDVSCKCSWLLEIHRNTLAARLLGRAGAVVATGDPELDAAIVVQADDVSAVRRWLKEPAVRSRLLSLFQQHQAESVSLRDEGSVLRAEVATHNPLVAPKGDAAGITETLRALAETLEQR